jgi:hypothetical protein
VTAGPCAVCGRTVERLRGTFCSTCYVRRWAVTCAGCRTSQPVRVRTPDGRPWCKTCTQRRIAATRTEQLRDGIVETVRAVEGDLSRPVIRAAAVAAAPNLRQTEWLADALTDHDALAGSTMVCVVCGRERPCEGVRAGSPRCEACARRREPCSWCGKTAKVIARWAAGPICTTCRYRGLEAKTDCACCGRRRRPDPRHSSGWCSDCAGLPPLCVCTVCGSEDRLYTVGRCWSCTLAARLDTLLVDGDGSPAEHLDGLRVALMATDRPRAALRWLAKPATRDILARLARDELDLTHAALDGLGGGKAVEFTRAVLVTAGVLPHRDEAMARLEAWVAARLAAIADPQDRRIVEAFATWWVVRRQRHREARAPTGQTDRARTEIAAAIAFLEFLHGHDWTLATCTQADVELWLSGPPGRGYARDFVRWAHRRRLCVELVIPHREQAWPARQLDPDTHLALVRRLLTDAGVPLGDRIAGLFVACYGSPPPASVGSPSTTSP